MVRYGLFLLKMPLNTNQPTSLTMRCPSKGRAVYRDSHSAADLQVQTLTLRIRAINMALIRQPITVSLASSFTGCTKYACQKLQCLNFTAVCGLLLNSIYLQ